ncbi:unnamed protein product (macronuclear) [Paramecium tetraurelia]|uniref:Uncharacterized protein n=1 Tax=Paramecium tetraurelia TaxID=5888 RepID=A0C270_PARTE|nr:uncharacterized protein GSPATT00034364001 [Paramecium tetraurelia]CAK64887.1 unnamed protein product [Paramecium tetraurelia]|eukprot:XP_001432284.1 hypothetical protein (macronuclear) [Paramecium tetraurelia strain d4-2]
MAKISLLKVLFLHPILIYKSCLQPDDASCYNNNWIQQVEWCGDKLYIGRFGQSTRISKLFTNNNEGRLMKFSFTLGRFDSWDGGEFFWITLDNKLVVTTSVILSQGSNLCFNSWLDVVEQITCQFQLPLGKQSFVISLQSNLNDPIYDGIYFKKIIESWGIRNVILQVLDPCVTFFSECNFEGQKWNICTGNQTSPSRQLPFPIKSIKITEGIVVQLKDPNYYGGVLQSYTSDQACLTGFHVFYNYYSQKFPKYEQPV